jgi:F-type H+-transporting ATPase subunit a
VSLSQVVASGLDCHLNSGCGFPAPGAEIFNFDDIAQFTIVNTEVHINKITVLLFICVAVPRGAQNVGEMGYLFVRDGIAREIIGKDGDPYVPFLFAFFFLVWLSNFMGIVPFAQVPVTSIFAIPVAFALIVYITWVPLGVYKQGFRGFFGGMLFPPGVPKAMYVLLTPLEFLSNLIVRPATHAIRLFANMFAGHLLIATFSIAAFYLLSASVIGILGSAASFVVAIALTAFEALIQFLQAYIFTLLAAVYISGALHAEH